ncbi:MCE family protein [Nocardia bovistercoris]|uniref:MCE family protein n=1 Tax=Nocardia bovistercoris TaxID=2785916 RepID=A0A931N3S6_9NOCA|nr:MlaD family protein [Nocardia bovistercoris]MBH0778042.1 MCE family protein [Nocardia bovistercoris]
MNFRRSVIGLSLFLVVAFALIWMTFVTLNRGVDGETSSYSAIFTDATGLRVGDDVRMAGVRVGRVDAVELTGTRARVKFRVAKDQRVYGDTTAAITYQNVIGQRYLGLAPGKTGDRTVARPGAEIPVERTEPSFDLSALLNGFEPLFGGLDPRQVDNVSAALVKALQGDAGSLTMLIEQMSTLAQSLAGPDQVLGAVITNLNQVVQNLATRRTELGTLLTQTRSIVDGLARHRAELMTTLTEVSGVADRMATVVAEDRPALEGLLTREPGFTRHFEQNKAQFEYLGFNLPALLKGIARVGQEGANLNVYLCNLNFTVLPALSDLIPAIIRMASTSGAVEQSPICR